MIVDTERGMKEVGLVGDQGKRGDFEEGGTKQRAVGSVGDYLWVHLIIWAGTSPAAKRPTGRSGGLTGHIVDEEIRVRVHVGWLEAFLEGGGPQNCRAPDWDRSRVNCPSGCRGRRAVGRVPN